MIYFKKYELPQYSYEHIEKALRKASLKRTSSLDMMTPSYNIGTEKSFFGYEGKKALIFTRIKTSFEKILPKVIINLQPGNNYYEARLGVPASLLFLLISLSWALNLVYFLMGVGNAAGLFTVTIMAGIYIGILLFELKLTTLKVNKAVTTKSPAVAQSM